MRRDSDTIADMIESLGEIFQSTDFDHVDRPAIETRPVQVPDDTEFCEDWETPLANCYHPPPQRAPPDAKRREGDMFFGCRIRFLPSGPDWPPKRAKNPGWGPVTAQFNKFGNERIIQHNSGGLPE
jgi:hypothetical protein